jgi:hypothetical protein
MNDKVKKKAKDLDVGVDSNEKGVPKRSTPHYGSNNPKPSLKEQGKRVFVTKFSMAHWYAQTFNFSIHDIPRAAPSDFEGSNMAWSAIRGKMGDYVYGRAPE